jgi:hypothetical protein
MIREPKIGMRVIVKYDGQGRPVGRHDPDLPWYRSYGVRGVIMAIAAGDPGIVHVKYKESNGVFYAMHIVTNLMRLELDPEESTPGICRAAVEL